MQEQRIATIVWRGKWLILLSLVLSIAMAVFVTQHSKKVYAANAVLQVSSPGGSSQSNTDSFQQLQANQTLATTYATVLGDRSFLAKIRPRVAHGRYTVSDLQSLVGARAIQAQITALGNEIERLSSSGKAGDRERAASLRLARAALTQQLATLVANNIQQAASISLTAPATASSSPVKPRPMLNLLAGIMLGLLLGVFLAWLRDRLDRGLHSAEEAEELLSAPVLAAIPLRKRYTPEDSVVAEAHDVLRANLAFLSLDQAM